MLADRPLEARFLGGFEIRLAGRPIELPSRPAQSLLAYLILSAGKGHRREKLAGMLWPDADEENARSYLRHALWRIRKATAGNGPPGGYFLTTDNIAIAFDRAADYWLDVAEFERGGDQGTVADLISSVAAYRGELLPGFYDEWAVLERERLEAILPEKMQRLLDRLSKEGRWREAIYCAERWIALGGVSEEAYRALMRAHHELSEPAHLASAYERCVSAVRREFDIDPSDATQQLFGDLSRSDRSGVAADADTGLPTLLTHEAETAPGPGPSPFKGLHYFDEIDADIFFGRQTLIARLMERLRGTSFLAIVGASGSGKSSILRAGLIPALRAVPRAQDDAVGDLRIIVLTPTVHPLEALAASVTSGDAEAAVLLNALAEDPGALSRHLTRARRRTVLAIDQFEELFTLCRNAFEREALVDNLLGAADPGGDARAVVVLTLRADFYAHCAENPVLRSALSERQEYIGPMGVAELRQAIEGPAANGGWTLDPGLIDLLLRDIGEEPGALPLLSHALLETWHRRRGRRLTIEGYVASGGVRGAIARTAESVFECLTQEQQGVARRIFLRLTELGDGTQDTRRRASLDELTLGPAHTAPVQAVLGVLADARLVTTGEKTVEVAHEALIREWPRLRAWLDEDREALRSQRDLARSALEWARLGRDCGVLYRGARMARAIERVREEPEVSSALEHEFLEASRELAQREEREREEGIQRELDAAHRIASVERTAAEGLRRRAIHLALALVVLAAAAGAAVFFAERSNASATAAEVARTQALLESARGAAANIDSRLGALRDAISPPALREQVISLILASDPELPAVLRSLHVLSGADTDQLFVIDYRRDVVVAVSDPFGYPAAAEQHIGQARRAIAGSAPDPIEGCKLVEGSHAQVGLRPGPVMDALSPLYVSRAYGVSFGQAPSITMIKYNQPCVPYAVAIEVSLRRAPEWMSIALAPTDDAYLIDGEGRLLARARGEAEPLRDLSASGLALAALSAADAVVRAGDDPLGGGPRLAAVAPVGETNWRVIVLRRSVEARPDAAFEPWFRGGSLGLVVLLVAAAALRVRRARGGRHHDRRAT